MQRFSRDTISPVLFVLKRLRRGKHCNVLHNTFLTSTAQKQRDKKKKKQHGHLMSVILYFLFIFNH